MGLDLPPEEQTPPYVDIDSDSSSGFEDGLEHANNMMKDTDNSFERISDRGDGLGVVDVEEMNLNDFMNNSSGDRGANKRVMTATTGEGNKRGMGGPQSQHNQSVV